MVWDTGFLHARMIRHLWIKFFLLLVTVAVIALSASLLLRELMVRDFIGYLEGEREDRVYWVAASLESSYEEQGGWNQNDLVKNSVWALMLGFQMKLYDRQGDLVIDTDTAVQSLSPLVKKRILALAAQRSESAERKYVPYDLFLGGQQIGRIQVLMLEPRRETLYISRSNRLMLLSLVVLGGVAVLMSIVFARGLTRPISAVTEAVGAIAEGNFRKRVETGRTDEIGRLSEAINAMARKLELQETLRRRLTANVAHELRTPVAAIQAELEGMSDGLIPLTGENITSLQEEISRLKRILEGLEELAQAEASGLNLKHRTFFLKPFLAAIAERFGRALVDRDIRLSVDCPDDIVALADPDRISQIIINLLSNAGKAVGSDGSIRLVASATSDAVSISVYDSGSGIRDEDLPFVFERFFRSSEGGLGIGLAIARELAEAHGGSLTAGNSHAGGAVFTLALPR